MRTQKKVSYIFPSNQILPAFRMLLPTRN